MNHDIMQGSDHGGKLCAEFDEELSIVTAEEPNKAEQFQKVNLTINFVFRLDFYQ